MANQHTNFWLRLLEFGENEQERIRNWNIFCIKILKINLNSVLKHVNQKEMLTKHNSPSQPYDPAKLNPLRQLAKKYVGPLELPTSSVAPESFMNFSDTSINEDISFAGRILIGVDFRNVEFEHNADFSDSTFLGLSHFDRARFRSKSKDGMTDGISFRRSEFDNTVYFESTKFMFRTRFDGAVFHSAAEFTRAKFDFGVDFEGSEFIGTTSFNDASILKASNFNNAKFSNTTSFRNTIFGEPPRFFETELHEDSDFSGTDWSAAEKSYLGHKPRGSNHELIKQKASDAVRAWDRLALIMSQREKLAERHEFFSLKMRAQRKRDGCCLLSLSNWLFDKSSDYGWSIGQAFIWWAAHIVLGAVLMSFPHRSDVQVWFKALRDGLLLSFSNAHAILGLASTDGYLHGARENLYKVTQSDCLLNTVGAFQIILGPIFLFLVLLTLRNRFRIG